MGRPGAEDQLRRLLAMVPWVIANDGPSVEEVCLRFGVTPAELAKDLELLPMCGVAPFTPDALIEADIDDGRVWIRLVDWFRLPLRLTHLEALTVVAAGQSLLAIPGTEDDGALARALDKLAGALGVDPDEAIDVELAEVDGSLLDSLRAAAGARRQVRIGYYSHGRDEATDRVVEPHRVFSAEGQWYVRGWCHLAAAARLFRVDRITGYELLDTAFDPPTEPSAGDAVFEPSPEDPVIVLDLDASASWVAESYPNEGVELLADGRQRVRLRSGQRAWLERLLLRIGPAGTVVDGDDTVGSGAAKRVLSRYSPR